MTEDLRHWLESREAGGVSDDTLYLYGHVARQISEFARRRGIEDLTGLTTREVERFALELRERVRPTTAQSYLRTLKYFFRWLGREEPGLTLPRVPNPKVPQPEVQVLSEEEMQRLAAAPARERDRLMLEVLTTCGLRASELCGLEVGDVLRVGNRYGLQVHGKGARDRKVPITPTLFRRLRQYVEESRPVTDDEHLFVSVGTGPSGDHEPLTPSGLRRVVKLAAQRAGLDHERVYTHLLRHSMATLNLRRRVGDIAVANVLGHADLRMLKQHYGHLSFENSYDMLMEAARSDPRRPSRRRQLPELG